MEPLTSEQHFHFGIHPDHGFVATPTAHITAHLANWLLIHEQFEPVPGPSRLYRLTRPEQDGQRRTRQAIHDLRRNGYAVHADYSLDELPSYRPPPASRNRVSVYRSRIARAAAASSPQRTAPPARTPGPRPSPAPAVNAAETPQRGRAR